jgi:cobyrinic acid a,c-diamide synthase
MSKLPGVVIAGTHSGVGKTTVTLGIMSLLVSKGYTVQGFKVGPDYIDPSFYQGITGRPGENLDSWMTSLTEVKRIYRESGQGAQLAVVEGVMGLFDGAVGDSETGSSAEIAKKLGLPVILVIDARSMARSVAPLIKGFTEFDRDLQFGGIIFNRVGSDKHRQILIDAAKTVTDIEILGFLNKDTSLSFPERHLGLAPFYENPEFKSKLSGFADLFNKTIELNSLLNVFKVNQSEEYFPEEKDRTSLVRIGVAIDEAFGFYYQDNLRLLRQAGADLLTFSPLKDQKLPLALDGLYIGGGYPELFAEQLASNKALHQDLKTSIVNGLPTYAECGGLMYLSNRIRTTSGDYPMIGILNLEVEMGTHRESLGYTEITSLTDNILLKNGQKARGHEFHYSRITKTQEKPGAYLVRKGGITTETGFSNGNLLASYIHLHFASNHGIAERFVEKCREYSNR